jgi:hypothetical protein
MLTEGWHPEGRLHRHRTGGVVATPLCQPWGSKRTSTHKQAKEESRCRGPRADRLYPALPRPVPQTFPPCENNTRHPPRRTLVGAATARLMHSANHPTAIVQLTCESLAAFFFFLFLGSPLALAPPPPPDEEGAAAAAAAAAGADAGAGGAALVALFRFLSCV